MASAKSKNFHEFFSHSKYHPISKISSKMVPNIQNYYNVKNPSCYHMWDSPADRKHKTVLFLFADAIDPLGPGGGLKKDLSIDTVECLHNTTCIPSSILLNSTFKHSYLNLTSIPLEHKVEQLFVNCFLPKKTWTNLLAGPSTKTLFRHTHKMDNEEIGKLRGILEEMSCANFLVFFIHYIFWKFMKIYVIFKKLYG